MNVEVHDGQMRRAAQQRCQGAAQFSPPQLVFARLLRPEHVVARKPPEMPFWNSATISPQNPCDARSLSDPISASISVVASLVTIQSLPRFPKCPTFSVKLFGVTRSHPGGCTKYAMPLPQWCWQQPTLPFWV